MKRTVAVMVVLLVGSLVAPAAAGAFVEERADVAVEQPHYINSDVQTTAGENGTQTIEATGELLRIKPQNFDREDVTNFGIERTTDTATLSENRDLGLYELETTSNGTFTLYWIVEETRQVNNSSQTVEVRYNTRVNVDQDNLRHVEAGVVEEGQEDAANWSSFAAAVQSERVAGTDANMDEEAQTAINLLRLKYHPFSALTGHFTGLLLTLFLTLSGLVLVMLAVGMHLASRRKDIVEQRRQRKLDSERADLEDELDAIEEHERLSALEGMDWNDVPDFDDATARSFREQLGETVLDGWLTIESVLTPETLVRDRLQAMADTHVAVRDPVPDGGTAVDGGSWTLTPKGDLPEDGDRQVCELDNLTDDVVAGLDWDDPELREFDLSEADINHVLDIDELTDGLGVDIGRDFEDEQQFNHYLVQFLQTVVDHEYTDKDGRVRPMRHALNLWLRTLRFVGEREGVPTARYSAEHVQSLLDTHDSEAEISEWVNKVETGQEGI